MRRFVSALLVSSALSSAPALAQQDKGREIIELIYTKLVDSIDLRRKGVEDTRNKYFFVLSHPGLFIDPALLTSTGDENIDLKRTFSEVIDRVMEPSWVYVPKDETYHEYVNLILRTYEHKALPLSADQQKQLADALILLQNSDGTPTKIYQTYLDYEEKYTDAYSQGIEWLLKNPGASEMPLTVSTPIKNADQQWRIFGKKGEVEVALETGRRYSPDGVFADAKTLYDRVSKEASLHRYYPSIKTWLDTKQQWPTISVSWSKTDSFTKNRHTSMSGSGGFSLGGFFSFGSSAGSDRVRNVEQNEATKVDVTFEYMRVDFRRPWLTRRIFSDSRWRFACGTEPSIRKLHVSSGPGVETETSVEVPTGMMPLIPTGFLIVRNAQVTGDFSEDFREYYKRVITASGSSGWGPFKVRGSYSDTVETNKVEAETFANGFRVGHPQIIGFFTEVLPQSPTPLPDLFPPCEEPAAAEVEP